MTGIRTVCLLAAVTMAVTAHAATNDPLTPENAQFFFGDLHQHSNFSDGDMDPEQLLKAVRDKKVLDFMALTDHSQRFDNPENWKKSTEWAAVKKLADKYTVDGQFVVLPGFEWSKNQAEGSGGTGHLNVYNTEWFSSAMVSNTPMEWFYGQLAKSPGSLAQFNHPGNNTHKSFAFRTPAVDSHVCLFEIATRSNAKAKGVPRLPAYLAALDKGWHVAPTDNTDSHKGMWWADNCRGRSVVIAQQLTRDAIYDAMRNRRVYASYDQNLRVMFTVNGRMMGSILDKPEKLKAEIHVVDPDKTDAISKIEVLTEKGGVEAVKEFGAGEARWTVDLDAGKRYHFLRITEKDGDLAFSAPVWTKR